jgi:parvulin-like peptidyl-prolyl isomerase
VNSEKIKRMGKISLAAAALAALVGLGTFGIAAVANAQGTSGDVGATATPDQTTPSVMPTNAAPDEEAIVEINGQRLSKNQFMGSLIELHGLDLFIKWRNLTVLQQACQKAGITVGDAQVDSQIQQMIDQLAQQYPSIPPNEREAVLEKAVQDRTQESFAEFRLDLATRTYMLALAKGHVPAVTEDQIQQVYNVNYGPRVEVQDIVVDNLEDAATVRHLIMVEHKDVGQVAQQYSVDKKTAANNGMEMIPLDDDSLPKLFRDTANQLNPNELSAAMPLDNEYHLLWLIKKIPTASTPLAQVHDQIKQQVENALEMQWGQNELNTLLLAAKIQIDDPVLDKQYQAIQAQLSEEQLINESEATQSATQPSGIAPSPATPPQ